MTFNYLIQNPPIGDLEFKTLDLNNPPLVSFCIPTLNNERTIRECMESIQAQEYPRIEIVIVDGGSIDETTQIAKEYTNLIFEDKGPLGSARQTSIEHSSGKILALFDSDIIIPHKMWLRNALSYFNYSEKVSTVWPANTYPPQATPVCRLYFKHWRLIVNHRMTRAYGLFGGGNALFLRSCIETIGGVNRALHWGEDFDWAKRLKENGYSVVFIDDPLYHDTMNSLKEFARKQFVGAATFSQTGFGLMNMTLWDVIYEQYVIGVKGSIGGIIKERDFDWLLFPMLQSLKSLAYSYKFLVRMVKEC